MAVLGTAGDYDVVPLAGDRPIWAQRRIPLNHEGDLTRTAEWARKRIMNQPDGHEVERIVPELDEFLETSARAVSAAGPPGDEVDVQRTGRRSPGIDGRTRRIVDRPLAPGNRAP